MDVCGHWLFPEVPAEASTDERDVVLISPSSHFLRCRSQNFRHAEEGNERVRAQIIVRGVMVHNRKVIDPRMFLIDRLGADKDLVDKIDRTNAPDCAGGVIKCFEDLDDAQRRSAAISDESKHN